MNPFDLAGPAFLGFYAALGLAVILLHRWAQRAMEPGGPAAMRLDDPYEIAYLRGGPAEAARVAALALIDRGRLELRQVPRGVFGLKRFVLAPPALRRGFPGRDPLEQAVEAAARDGVAPDKILGDPEVVAAAHGYRERLIAGGLLRGSGNRAEHYLVLAGALLIMLGIAGLRLEQAFLRHRMNIGFLIMLALLAVILLIAETARSRTNRGDRAIRDLAQLCAGLKARAATIQPGAMTADALLLAAVFGLTALPGDAYAGIRRALQRPIGDGGSGDGGGGGGGDGGGGGGCGGCGG